MDVGVAVQDEAGGGGGGSGDLEDRLKEENRLLRRWNYNDVLCFQETPIFPYNTLVFMQQKPWVSYHIIFRAL